MKMSGYAIQRCDNGELLINTIRARRRDCKVGFAHFIEIGKFKVVPVSIKLNLGTWGVSEGAPAISSYSPPTREAIRSYSHT